jgi:hypothetical protein
VNPGDPDSIARWDSIRKNCCQSGWLDHIQVQPDVKDVIIAELRAEIERLKAKPS